MKLRGALAVLALGLAGSTTAMAGPPPPPDWRPDPPQVVYAPAPAVVYVEPAPLPPPRPIPVALRVVYAPFYVAGLTIRYGLYYGIVVPLEVFGRALTFGYEGGVDDREGNKDGHR